MGHAPAGAHLPAGRWRLTMLRGCRPVSGLSLIVSVIVIIAIWQRLCAYPEDAGGSPNRGGLSEPRRRHRIETRERSLADCVPTCWWQQTSLLSHFTRSTICSRLTPGGRVSISGRMLIQTQGGTRAEQQLDTDDVLLAAYREHFGIVLSRVPDDPAA